MIVAGIKQLSVTIKFPCSIKKYAFYLLYFILSPIVYPPIPVEIVPIFTLISKLPIPTNQLIPKTRDAFIADGILPRDTSVISPPILGLILYFYIGKYSLHIKPIFDQPEGVAFALPLNPADNINTTPKSDFSLFRPQHTDYQ